MSIKARVDDAAYLWQHGRLEGALLSALVAVAATARLRYSDRKQIGDREAFERFLQDSHTVRIDVEYHGELQPVEHICYKWLRCELVHAGDIPVDIQFIKDSSPGTMSVRAGGHPEYILQLSEGWFHHFMTVVIDAPENAKEFPKADQDSNSG